MLILIVLDFEYCYNICMIGHVQEYYHRLPPAEKAIARGVGYLGSSLVFGYFTLISGRICVSENQPALYVFEGLGLIVTVETAKKAWKSFQEGCRRG